MTLPDALKGLSEELREDGKRALRNAENGKIPALDRRQCYGVSQAYEDSAHRLDALLSSLGTRTEAKQPTVDALHDVFTRHGIASRTDLPVALISDLIHWAAEECRGTRTEAPQTEGCDCPNAKSGWHRVGCRYDGMIDVLPTGQTQEREP